MPAYRISREAIVPPRSRHAFLAVCALVFSASLALTMSWSARMQEMGEMQMPGGWTLSAIGCGCPDRAGANLLFRSLACGL